MENTNKITVKELIEEVKSGFECDFSPSFRYLLGEYNKITSSLRLMIPTPDKSITLTPAYGKLECRLLPSQVKRVIAKDFELLRASRELVEILPEAKLYCPTEDAILVTTLDECTVYYTDLDAEVTEENASDCCVLQKQSFLPLVRAHLQRCAYLYVGDYVSADAYSAEYNRLLEDFKAENGVK